MRKVTGTVSRVGLEWPDDDVPEEHERPTRLEDEGGEDDGLGNERKKGDGLESGGIDQDLAEEGIGKGDIGEDGTEKDGIDDVTYHRTRHRR